MSFDLLGVESRPRARRLAMHLRQHITSRVSRTSLCSLNGALDAMQPKAPQQIVTMNSDHIAITRQILLEHIGVLADIVIEDALSEMHAKPQAEPVQWLREFILRVTKGLPTRLTAPKSLSSCDLRLSRHNH